MKKQLKAFKEVEKVILPFLYNLGNREVNLADYIFSGPDNRV